VFSEKSRNVATTYLKTIYVRWINILLVFFVGLKCLVPCLNQRARSSSPDRSAYTKEEINLENCKELTHTCIGAQYEDLIQAERHQELLEIRKMRHNACRRKAVSTIHWLWNVIGSFIRWPCTWNYGTLSRIYHINFKAVLIRAIEAVVAKCINMTNAFIRDLMVQCSYYPELRPRTKCLQKDPTLSYRHSEFRTTDSVPKFFIFFSYKHLHMCACMREFLCVCFQAWYDFLLVCVTELNPAIQLL